VTPIGYIEPDTNLLVVTDKDNLYLWNKQTPHLGLDKCILFAKLLNYHYITFSYKKKKYQTTRKFFMRNSRPHNLFNGRDMLFLPLREFDLSKAIRADIDADVEQLELFKEGVVE